ncbi:hypothetical protein KaCgl_26180 [Corynebacterium glutamicum]|nr:hypothetical protein KaCgl_26180 [Corynebacterium glutamicum]
MANINSWEVVNFLFNDGSANAATANIAVGIMPNTPIREALTPKSSRISETSGAKAVIAVRRLNEVRMIAASAMRRGFFPPLIL